MNPIVYAIPVFMLTILIEAFVARRRRLRVYDIPDAVTSLHHGVLSQVAGAFTKVLGVGIYAAIHAQWRLVDLPADSLWVWIAALLFYDLCYYWAHRMGHEVNILWAAHVVHHSSEYYNLATALRQTSTGGFLGWIFYVPMALLGFPPEVFVVVALIDLLYQYWVHTELVGSLGWFDRVFCSPSNHRVHHGQNDYCIDKNYGGILILWDRLFGTFEQERRGPGAESIKFGIRNPLRSYNPVWGNLHYYAEILTKMRATSGIVGKLGVIFAPPGGWHQPLPHFEPAAFHRFDTATPSAIRHYVAAQYALAVPFIGHFLARFSSLPLDAALLYGVGIVLTTLSLGTLLQRASATTVRIEQLRIGVLGVIFATQSQWFGDGVPPSMRLIMAAFALASVLWLARNAR